MIISFVVDVKNKTLFTFKNFAFSSIIVDHCVFYSKKDFRKMLHTNMGACLFM